MARAWIRDLWTKDVIEEVNGEQIRLTPSGKVDTMAPKFRTSRWKQGSRWAVEWFDDDKKKRSKRFKTRTDAEEFRAELEDDQRSGRYISPEVAEQPFRDVAEHWYKTRRKAGPSTLLQYRGDLDKYVLPRWGQTPIGKIQTSAIEAWVSDLYQGTAPTKLGGNAGATPLAASTVKRIVSTVFGGCLRSATSRRIITVNPLDPVELVSVEPQKPEAWLTVEEVEALAEAAGECGGETSRVLVRFLAYSGLRIGEALALHVGDLDVEARDVHVQRRWQITESGRVERDGTKGGRTRHVPLPLNVVEELEEMTRGRGPSEYVFTASGGAAMDDHNWRSRVWKTAVEGAGLGDIAGLVPHSLRHTFASLAIAGGVDVVTLSKVMGHKKPSITLDVYSHIFERQTVAVADIISAAINKQQPDPLRPSCDRNKNRPEPKPF